MKLKALFSRKTPEVVLAPERVSDSEVASKSDPPPPEGTGFCTVAVIGGGTARTSAFACAVDRHGYMIVRAFSEQANGTH